MKLIDYLNAIPVEARESFAARCGTSFDYLRQVGYGNRTCSEKLAINLERESGRMLTCEELCPATDWAFIRSTAPTGKRRAVAQSP
jgi:DNA-binding transcriptional regulator YdaS (Cro superfamily)